jgi:hypothetical protein
MEMIIHDEGVRACTLTGQDSCYLPFFPYSAGIMFFSPVDLMDAVVLLFCAIVELTSCGPHGKIRNSESPN